MPRKVTWILRFPRFLGLNPVPQSQCPVLHHPGSGGPVQGLSDILEEGGLERAGVRVPSPLPLPVWPVAADAPAECVAGNCGRGLTLELIGSALQPQAWAKQGRGGKELQLRCPRQLQACRWMPGILGGRMTRLNGFVRCRFCSLILPCSPAIGHNSVLAHKHPPSCNPEPILAFKVPSSAALLFVRVYFCARGHAASLLLASTCMRGEARVNIASPPAYWHPREQE
jgi:hypothetical protein